MINEFYGVRCNPFAKNAQTEKNAFVSADHEQMIQRLEYLKTVGSIGVFTAQPGMGKTFALRCFFAAQKPNLTQTAYIPLTTVPATEFYGVICDTLGLERSARRSTMFRTIREYIYGLYKEKRRPLIMAVDEAQYLEPAILHDLKMLLNYEYDSQNCFALVLLGEPQLTITLKKPIHAALRQRISVEYAFAGMSMEETMDYIRHKMKAAGGTADIFGEAALNSIYSLTSGNPRKIDILLTHALTIGAQSNKSVIDAETIQLASDNIALK